MLSSFNFSQVMLLTPTDSVAGWSALLGLQEGV